MSEEVIDPLDVAIWGAVLVGSVVYWLKDRVGSSSSSSSSASSAYKKSFTSTSSMSSSTTAIAKQSIIAPAVAKKPGKTRNFVQKMKQTDKTVIFFYGSQTGTAEDYASRLAKEGSQMYGLKTMTADLEEYNMNLLDTLPEDHLAFFVLATYGEGEPTDNAVEFWEHLVTGEDLPEFSTDDYQDPERPLSNLHFVMFGLGNKTYEHYNSVCRKVDEKLSNLGATRIGERGEGDDDGSLEEDFLSWKDNMWKAVCDFVGIDFSAVGSLSGPRQATYKVVEYTPEEAKQLAKIFYGEHYENKAVGSRPTYDAKNPYSAPISVSRELFAASADRHCLHMEIDIAGSGITYQTGDHIAIWPVNAEDQVLKLASIMNLSAKLDAVVTVSNTDPASTKLPFPVPTTYRTILRNYLDITAPPSRAFIGQLAPFAPNETSSQALAKLGEDKEAFRLQVADTRRSVATVLEKLLGHDQIIEIPFDLLIESVPRLQARYYSISSSPKAHPTSIHLTAVVLDYQPATAPEETVYGLATNYLHVCHAHLNNNALGASLPVYDISGPQGALLTADGHVKVPMHVRHSNFKLPRNSAVPVVMVGPGTGVAPFRGFIQDRAQDAKSGKKTGATVLFFGCRREDEDYLYKDEWDGLMAQLGEGSRVITALSRQPGVPKTYVQHCMTEHKELVWDLIHAQGGYFYVCGDAKNMAREVNHRLVEIAMECGGLTEDKATNYVKDLRSKGRYEEDVWS
ncbi:NADPH-cytochrome P450 reductase [Podila minutissima]|uniref:NADPH--cytochrome P450 reductase n=1 Tax=Podila minutissima TaxID=64525 RepID=A0A9P5SSL4_9FUNG|nr:NADPH-cytochrome P450 reductase [Podila minutissima]